MKSIILKSIGIILTVIIIACNENVTTGSLNGDIIPVINLNFNSEKEIVLEDLFFLENYDIELIRNEFINAELNKNKKSIVIKSKNNFIGTTTVDFKFNNIIYSIPVTIHKNPSYKFQFTPSKKYKELYLFGSFNGWNRKEIAMTDENNDGTFEAEVSLEPGVYQYKFFGDGEEIVDPANSKKVPNGFGSFNSIRTIKSQDKERIFLHTLKYAHLDDGIFLINFKVEGNQFSQNLTTENIIALCNNEKIDKENIKVNKDEVAVQFHANKKSNDVLRVAVTNNGRTTNFQNLFFENGNLINNNSNFDWHDGIIYSLMIDRFNDGDKSLNNPVIHDSLSDKANYMGGDLQGVIDKLEENYFNNLGINTLWISPVYDNPNNAFREYPEPHRWYSGYHGYWPISSTRVEEKFGTMKKLKELVKTAHKHNIKVLLDFVSNHVHKNHPFFQKHRDWFGTLDLPDGRKNIRFWDEFRLTTWFEPYLPSFDYLGSQTALDTVTANAVWWLKVTGADGFRHDAVKHVPNKFWRELTKKIKREIEIPQNKRIYQIGETFGSYDLISSYVNNGQLSAQFNFNLYDTALPTFIKENKSFSDLNKEIHKSFSVYGNINLMGNIMDSHDKNRFMAYADGDLDVSQWSAIEEGWNNPPKVDNPDNYKKLILYMAYMNTIPGIPVIYYGSEFGMTGASDPDNRRMMRFGSQLSKYEKKTLEAVSEIIKIRKATPALRYGDFYTIIADKNIYAFVRSYLNNRVLVVLNKSRKEKNFTVELPPFYNATNIISIPDSSDLTVQKNKINIKLTGMNFNIYKILTKE